MGKSKEKSTKKKIGLMIQKIFFVILIFLIIICCSVLYKVIRYPDRVPDIFGIKPLIVLSGSMEPEIQVGDLALVKEVDVNSLKEEDIIAFRNESNTVTTHRIVDIIESNGEIYFETKGDNNKSVDVNLVPTSDVEGKFFKRIGGLGSFFMFIHEPLGLAVIILGILVIGLFRLNMVEKQERKLAMKKNLEETKENKKDEKKETKV